MTATPKVSVIVPVYNCEEYLPRCLDSLLRQTLNDMEIVLIDDGSTDQSADICRRYAREYSNVHCLFQPNGGAAGARIAGIQAARGEYLAFVDSDDWVDRNMFFLLSRAIEDSRTDIVQCGFTEATDEKSQEKDISPENPKTVSVPARQALMQMFGCPAGGNFSFTLCGKLIKSRLFDDLPLPRDNCLINDVQVVARVFGAARSVAFMDLPLYYYFHRNEAKDPSTMDLAYANESCLIQSHIEAFSNVSEYYRHRDNELYLASLKHTVSWAVSGLIRRRIAPGCRRAAIHAIADAEVWKNPYIPWKKKIFALAIKIVAG